MSLQKRPAKAQLCLDNEVLSSSQQDNVFKRTKNILIKIKRGWTYHLWTIHISSLSLYVLLLYNIGTEWLKFIEVQLIWKIIKWHYIDISKASTVEFQTTKQLLSDEFHYYNSLLQKSFNKFSKNIQTTHQVISKSYDLNQSQTILKSSSII